MRIRAVGYTSKGPNRAANEDSLLIDDDGQIFIVADGMGGHVGGAMASKMVSEELSSFIKSKLSDEMSGDVAFWSEELRNGVAKASETVLRQANENPEYRGMGTTLTALYGVSDHGVLAHVGDSRLYLLRDGVLHQLTTDHTVVQELLASGQLTKEAAVDHPYAHVLTRAVGTYESVPTDTLIFELALGDRLFLCSDGFYDVVSDEELIEFMKAETLEDALKQSELIPEERDSSDNVTALFLEVIPDEDHVVQEEKKSEEVSLKVDVLRQVGLFENLEMKEIVYLVQSGVVKRVSKGKVLLEEGASDRALYVLLAGEVEVQKGGAHLATLRTGNHFGEMSLLLDSPRSASVIATEDAMILELPFETIQTLLSESPYAGVDFLFAMSKEIAGRLAQANSQR